MGPTECGKLTEKEITANLNDFPSASYAKFNKVTAANANIQLGLLSGELQRCLGR